MCHWCLGEEHRAKKCKKKNHFLGGHVQNPQTGQFEISEDIVICRFLCILCNERMGAIPFEVFMCHWWFGEEHPAKKRKVNFLGGHVQNPQTRQCAISNDVVICLFLCFIL